MAEEQPLQQILAQLSLLQQDMALMKSQAASQATSSTRTPRATTQAMDTEDWEEAEEEEEGPTTWADLLGGADREPSQGPASRLVALLASPPPLSSVLKTAKEVPRYKGVPKTPAPRKFNVDRNLAGVQRKLEVGMSAFVHSLEKQDPQEVAVAAGLVRSAWEDIQQTRRRLCAGKQSFALKQRSDFNQPRLLDAEEEEKIRKARIPRGNFRKGEKGGKGGNYSFRSSSRFGDRFRRFPSNSGRGKGKGRKPEGEKE